MIRSFLLACAVMALTAPNAFAQNYMTDGGLPNTVYGERADTRGASWQNIDGYIAYVESPTSTTSMAIVCYGETVFELAIGVSVEGGINTLRERNDGDQALRVLHSTLRGGTVFVLDRGGSTLSSFRLNLDRIEGSEYGEGGDKLRALLTRPQLNAIRAADRIEVRNGQWTLRFTGNGSTRATNFNNCPMGGNF